jgi:hypothetical protein
MFSGKVKSLPFECDTLSLKIGTFQVLPARAYSYPYPEILD